MKSISHKSFAGFNPSYHMIYLTWLEQLASIFPGICFCHFFYYLYHCLSLLSKLIYFFWTLNNSSFILFIWMGQFPSDLKMCKEGQNLHTLMFSVFLLKTPARLCNLCLEVEKRNDSQHAVKKTLDFSEKFRSKF